MSEMTKLCGLWSAETKDGQKYLSGKLASTVRIFIDGQEVPSDRVMIFKNKFKKDGDKQPDYNVFVVPESSQKPQVVQKTAQAPVSKAALPYGMKEDEEIPF